MKNSSFSSRLALAMLLGAAACSRVPRDAPVDSATSTGAPTPAVTPSPAPALTADSVAARAVAAIERRDIEALAALAHPVKGIRFTPYTYVDTVAHRRLSAAQLRQLWAARDSSVWGESDGTGDPIRLTLRQYFDKFVDDFDIAGAPRVGRDTTPFGTGNSLNNIREVYPGATLIEYNTPGTDPRYGGMDWRSLWIVLEKLGADWYVVGLVHGSWTT